MCHIVAILQLTLRKRRIPANNCRQTGGNGNVVTEDIHLVAPDYISGYSRTRYLTLYLTLFIGFIVTGYILSFVTFQSQVMPIWLPAGIALTGCYIFGSRFFPAVLLGSFIFNCSVTPDFYISDVLSPAGLQNFVIASGATIQAVAGALLLRHWIGNPLYIDEKGVVKFVVLVGILINLLSANTGVWSLSIFNPNYNLDEYWLNVAFWWLGDSLGVLFAFPLILCLLELDTVKSQVKRARLIVISTVVCLFVSVLSISWFFIEKEKESTGEWLEKESQQIENQVYRELTKALVQLGEMSEFIHQQTELTKTVFENKARELTQKSQTLSAVSWNPIITSEQLEAHRAELKQVHQTPVDIKGDALEASDPVVYVKYIYPEQPNLNAIGFNVYSNVSRKKTIHHIFESFQPRATPIIHLVQDEKPEPAFLLFYPVFQHIAGDNAQASLHGASTGVFHVKKLMEQALNVTDRRAFFVEVSESGSERPFFRNYAGADRIDANNHFKAFDVDLIGQSWKIKLALNQSYISAKQSKAFGLLFFLQVLIVAAIVLIVLMMNSQQQFLDNLVESKTASLREATFRATQASLAKSRFLANMSHEIRTPMNSVIGFAQMANSSNSLDEVKQYLNKIGSSSKLLLNIINDILDISKIESNKFELSKEPFNAVESLDSVNDMFSALAEDKQLYWHFNCAIPKDLNVIGDRTRFEQVLMNLCSNALKFTESGGVTLNCAVLKSDDGNVCLKVDVADTGIGISENKRKEIFKPFVQEDSSTSRNFGGTGLGLTISSELSLLMGGEIAITENKPKGSVFSFTARFAISDKQPVEESKAEDADLSSLFLLVAEDNEINQQVIGAMLEQLQIQYRIVGNGQLVLDELEVHEFDGILMDCQMPVLDGYEATKMIKAHKEFNTLPVIALTADADSESRKYAMSIGFDAHVTKPVTLDQLRRCLTEVVISQKQLRKQKNRSGASSSLS